MDLSVVLPVLNERDNLELLVPRLRQVLEREHLGFEILIVDGGSQDGTREVAERMGARLLSEKRKGYAGALQSGFQEAAGEWVLTLDADLSHEPDFVAKLWRARNDADVLIASRYVRGGVTYGSALRNGLSRALNLWMRRLLSIPVRDMSSGFRLYRREILQRIDIEARNFDVLEEILVKVYAQGYSVLEVPFTYFPREAGKSHARLIRFGFDLLCTSVKLWTLRNSVMSADYDDRAFYSNIPIQRYWQRRRHRITTAWTRGYSKILDIGCGSSLIIQSLNNAIGLDFSMGKLRFLRRRGIPLIRGSAFALPFKDESFDCIIRSQVIEHVPYDHALFSEMYRLLRSGGRLIIGTPDYGTFGWRIIEPIYGFLMPGGYRDEHITHYTRDRLIEILTRTGFVVEETAYIARSELIMRVHKPDAKGHSVEPRSAGQRVVIRAA